jgi:hypothetical protein
MAVEVVATPAPAEDSTVKPSITVSLVMSDTRSIAKVTP